MFWEKLLHSHRSPEEHIKSSENPNLSNFQMYLITYRASPFKKPLCTLVVRCTLRNAQLYLQSLHLYELISASGDVENNNKIHHLSKAQCVPGTVLGYFIFSLQSSEFPWGGFISSIL